MTSRSPGALRLLALRVDLLVELAQTAREILDAPVVTQLAASSRDAAPVAVSGCVAHFGWLKIRRNVAKFGSGLSSGDVSDCFVVGTFRIAFENIASACVFVVR